MPADRARLHQVVANLLDNAARHSPAGGVVARAAEHASTARCCLEVADEGPGIPAADRERVFERFTPRQRTQRRRHRARPGHRPLGGRTCTAAAIAVVDPRPGETVPASGSSAAARTADH